MTLPSSSQLPLMRVDQVGSLLRPANLKEIFATHARGDATDEQLRQAQDEAIRAVIAKQEAHQLPIIADGEFRPSPLQGSLFA